MIQLESWEQRDWLALINISCHCQQALLAWHRREPQGRMTAEGFCPSEIQGQGTRAWCQGLGGRSNPVVDPLPRGCMEWCSGPSAALPGGPAVLQRRCMPLHRCAFPEHILECIPVISLKLPLTHPTVVFSFWLISVFTTCLHQTGWGRRIFFLVPGAIQGHI